MNSAELLRTIEATVASSDPASWPASRATYELANWAAMERLCAAQRIRAAHEVEVHEAWKGTGSRSAADYVAGATGLPVGRVATELSLVRKLEALPATAQAFREGRLSAGQAILVTDGALADPSAEPHLLAVAGTETHKGLQTESRRVRMAATDDVAREARIRRTRYFRRGINADGAYEGQFSMPAWMGVGFEAHFRPYEEAMFRDAKHRLEPEGTRPTYENRACDALHAMVTDDTCERCDGEDEEEPEEQDHSTPSGASPAVDASSASDPALERAPEEVEADDGGGAVASGSVSAVHEIDDVDAEGHQPLLADEPPARACASSGTGGPSTDPGRPKPKRKRKRKRRSRSPRAKAIVLIPHSVFTDGKVGPGETVEIAGLGPISTEAALEILERDDPFLTAVITDGVDVYNVAHLGRQVTAFQRTALQALRSDICSNIGCNSTVGIELDHREDWHRTHWTHVQYIDPLCSACHKLKTHHGWQLVPGTGRRAFLPPGRPGPTHDPPPGGELVGAGGGARGSSANR